MNNSSRGVAIVLLSLLIATTVQGGVSNEINSTGECQMSLYKDQLFMLLCLRFVVHIDGGGSSGKDAGHSYQNSGGDVSRGSGVRWDLVAIGVGVIVLLLIVLAISGVVTYAYSNTHKSRERRYIFIDVCPKCSLLLIQVYYFSSLAF